MTEPQNLFFDEPDNEYRFRIDAAIKYRTQHFPLRLNHVPQPPLLESAPSLKPPELCD